MTRTFISSALTLAVLLLAAFITFQFGLPWLSSSQLGCAYAGSKSPGCSTSFGTFIVYVAAGAAVLLGIIWGRPGRH